MRLIVLPRLRIRVKASNQTQVILVQLRKIERIIHCGDAATMTVAKHALKAVIVFCSVGLWSATAAADEPGYNWTGFYVGANVGYGR